MTDGRVTVVTMGPPQAKSILGDALAMGADDAYLVTDRKFGGSDTLATSYILASAARKLGPFDVILCGKQAIGRDTGQVGPEMANIWISLRSPMSVALRWTEKVSKRSENVPSTREIVTAQLPVVITVVKGEQEPRFETIRGRLHANRYEIKFLTRDELSVEDESIGLKGSATRVKRSFYAGAACRMRLDQGRIRP